MIIRVRDRHWLDMTSLVRLSPSPDHAPQYSYAISFDMREMLNHETTEEGRASLECKLVRSVVTAKNMRRAWVGLCTGVDEPIPEFIAIWNKLSTSLLTHR
jgi:hypothetical protein